uniref:bromo adjacent homology domain-containing 1 protein n=1 Tax=Euleptes europaea TaxID=460621 RepID=UPI00253F8F3F|nr:bromo adjacent homology domain-containing 1 protein [Euleptes europaea]
MTHARKKPLLLLKHSAGSVGQALSPIDGERMDRTEAEDSEQGNGTEGQSCQSRFAGVNKIRNSQEHRKTYPLRKRLSSSVDKKTCSVLLTRLEDVAGSFSEETQSVMKRGLSNCVDDFRPACLSDQVQVGGAGTNDSSLGKCTVSCPVTEQEGHDACLSVPRKRRLASLNAEAVNNLLFERDDGLLSGRRFRKDSTKVSGVCCTKTVCCKTQCAWPLLEKHSSKTVKGKNQNGSNRKCDPYDQLLDDVFDGKRREDSGVSYHPAPKRLASLNAVAFLKLTHEKDHPLKPRSKSTGEGKSENHCSKSKLKWAKANRKNCVKSKKETSTIKIEGQHGWQGVTEGAFRKVAHQDSPRIYGKAETISYEPLPNSCEGTEGFCHRLPLLMGGQASMKPEYGRPGEKSPTPKQEFHQPSFPVPQFHPLPVPGNHADCGCVYESSGLTPLNGFYVYYGQSGYSSYTHCSVYPKDELSQATSCEGLLVSPGSLPSDPSFQPFHWCNSPYCCGEGTAINNSYSLCGVMHVPESRVSGVHMGRNSYPYKMPFTADSCKSLDQLSLTIPVAGHPVSPAHPLSGCPVPSVPPAAEPVPHLQTPNSEPQTMARECPQSSKPPSGSKSGLRNTTSCLHVSDSKTARAHSHPKQQRINRRRATNGWVPVGAASEKAVYVVNEPEPAVRKSYQAVERDGEIIRVRDTVLLKSGPRKKSMPYVAKISALWEDPKTGELMMSLLWYYRPEHTQGGRNPSMHQNEIFASRHQDENSVACIEEKCYVLTFAEYCRFCALAKRRVEGIPGKKTVMVPPSEEYSTPAHRKVPEDTDPELVFLCRHVYDFRHGRILKNPQ